MMLSTFDLIVSRRSGTTTLRNIHTDCPATCNCVSCKDPRACDCLGDSLTVEHGRQDLQRIVAATVFRNLKRKRSLEAAPPRATSVSRPSEDVRRPILSPEFKRSKVDMSTKLVIVMVGLPARGKSYMTKKLCRYLNWLQHDTKIFNVGNQRRKVAGRPLDSAALGNCSDSAGGRPLLSDSVDHSAGFFDPDNLQASKLREQVAMETLGELLGYLLDEGGSVAIFDATNSTTERRRLIVQRVKERAGPKLRVLFLESQCFDEVLLQSNMRLKLLGPDYKNQDPVIALQDFKKRVAMYERKYVPLGENEECQGFSYCQMIDVGRKFITHNIDGYLATQVVGYLQHFNLAGRQVWFTRHGESLDNVTGKIGGDAELSPYGVKYAAALSRFIDHERNAWNRRQSYHPLTVDDDPNQIDGSLHLGADRSAKKFYVWTSMMQRSVQTAQFFDSSSYEIEHMRLLDELNAGMLEGLTEREVKELYANEYAERRRDAVRYRYPGTRGEGYLDVTKRLQSVILEMERVTDHVLFIGGLAITRILLAYCRGMRRHEIADLCVPLGTLYMLEPRPYGVDYKEFVYNSGTDWFDQK